MEKKDLERAIRSLLVDQLVPLESSSSESDGDDARHFPPNCSKTNKTTNTVETAAEVESEYPVISVVEVLSSGDETEKTPPRTRLQAQRGFQALSLLNANTPVLERTEHESETETAGPSCSPSKRPKMRVRRKTRRDENPNSLLRGNYFVERIIKNFTTEQFQKYFHVTLETYEIVLEQIGPALERRFNLGRNTMNVEKQFLSVLWLLATQDSYSFVGSKFDMGKSSVSTAFQRVIEALYDISPTMVKWPTEDAMTDIKAKFKSIANLDNVIGVIDSTLVPIHKTSIVNTETHQTKTFNAIILQAVCDANLRFTDTFVGYPDSSSEDQIFKQSDLYSNNIGDAQSYFPNDEFIIGNEAFPILTWCVRPFGTNQGELRPEEKHFNTIHEKTREPIQSAFALLFGRFHRLRMLDMNRHDLIPKIVIAACVLHNFCLEHEDLYLDEYINEGKEFVLNECKEYDGTCDINDLLSGHHKRDLIVNDLYKCGNNG